MKKSGLVLVVGLLFLAGPLLGQDYAFKVMTNKGSNEVKSGDSWQVVKPGSSLKSGDELKISENSYLGLMHATGKPVELRQAGNYKVADLAAKVSGGSSVMNKYADFILSSNAEGKKNKLSATGAVHRGLEEIKLYMPDNTFADVFNQVAIINWEAPAGRGPFVVVFKNMFDEELTKIETAEHTAQINLGTPEFANESAILVEVKSKADGKSTSKQHLIKKMNTTQSDKVKKEITDLGEGATGESALSKYILSGFYEEKKLYIDAVTAYQQAIKLAPDVPMYKEYYEDFLLRSALKTK